MSPKDGIRRQGAKVVKAGIARMKTSGSRAN
jgi:hypothetical protein